MLTDPTADAHVPHDAWTQHGAGLPTRIDHLRFFQADGLLRGGAHLLTYDTWHSACPGQATVLVNAGFTDHCQPFLFKRQQGDGTAWAYLTTGCAAIIAVAHTRHHQGGPNPCQPCFYKRRLQGSGGADFHALAAAQTS